MYGHTKIMNFHLHIRWMSFHTSTLQCPHLHYRASHSDLHILSYHFSSMLHNFLLQHKFLSESMHFTGIVLPNSILFNFPPKKSKYLIWFCPSERKYKNVNNKSDRYFYMLKEYENKMNCDMSEFEQIKWFRVCYFIKFQIDP